MEDNVSIKSSDSVTTSGEYEIVPELIDCTGAGGAGISNSDGNSINIPGSSIHKTPTKSPTLNIANNGDFNDLEKNLHEVIHELDMLPSAGTQNTISTMPPITTTGQGKHNIDWLINFFFLSKLHIVYVRYCVHFYAWQLLSEAI